MGTCRYVNRWEFAEDIELMFRNCSFFNEDTSEVSCFYDMCHCDRCPFSVGHCAGGEGGTKHEEDFR